MNPTLTTREVDALLEILYRGLVRIRVAALEGDPMRAEAIADALHNVPHLVSNGHQWGWSVAGFREMFLAPLIERYPDLAGLTQPLDELGT